MPVHAFHPSQGQHLHKAPYMGCRRRAGHRMQSQLEVRSEVLTPGPKPHLKPEVACDKAQGLRDNRDLPQQKQTSELLQRV